MKDTTVDAYSSAFNTAVSAYTSYNRAKHSAKMAHLQYTYNKAMQLESLKVNQFVLGRNRIALQNASAEEKQNIELEVMKARAGAEVAQSAIGIQGGSAQQVLFDISRQAAKIESQRLSSLDDALFENKTKIFQAESNALQGTGIRPVGTVSGALAIGSAAATFAAKMRDLQRPVKEG